MLTPEVPNMDYVVHICPQMNHGFHHDFTARYAPKMQNLPGNAALIFLINTFPESTC